MMTSDDARAMALLLAEGELAKANSIQQWLNAREGGDIVSRVILHRTSFAHRAAADRYLEIAKAPS